MVQMVSRAKLIESHVKLKVCEATDSNFFAGDMQVITIPESTRRPSENTKANADNADNTSTWERATQHAEVCPHSSQHALRASAIDMT